MSNLRGYDYSEVSLKKIQKDRYILASAVEQQIGRSELNDQMREVLANKGVVYFITRKKEVCGVVIIGYEKHVASDFTGLEQQLIALAKKKEKADEANAYVLKAIYCDEILREQAHVILDDLRAALIEKSSFSNLGVRVIVWGDKVELVKLDSSSAMVIGMSVGMSIGMLFGATFSIIYHNLVGINLGLMFGMSIGMAVGLISYGSSKNKEDNKVLINK